MSFLLKSMLKMEPVRKYFNVPKVDTAAVANKMNPKKEPFSFKGLIKGRDTVVVMYGRILTTIFALCSAI